MKRFFTLFVIFNVFPSFISAQDEALKLIDKDDMKAHMYFLASDHLGGRETGQPGNDIATLYINAVVSGLGLTPVSSTNSHLQEMRFSSRQVVNKSLSVRAENGSGKLIASDDSVISVMPLNESFELSGDLVFAGYGHEDKASGYSDFTGIDIANRIVLVMTRNPGISESPKYSSGYVFDEMVEGMKLNALFSRGPRAVFFVYDPKNKYGDPYSSGLAEMVGGGGTVSLEGSNSFVMPFKLFFITRTLADKLVASSGMTLKEIQEKIDSEKKPLSAQINGLKISVSCSVEKKNFTGYNVIGIVEGSDPVLKNECIVYTAHFDHTGISQSGEVFNGADDDASGAVGLLEIAEAFSGLKKKPLRSIVFVWVNAEEKGLLGSRFYADNPVIPMEKTLLNINFDMIGRSATPADTGSFMGFKLNVTGDNEVQMFSTSGIRRVPEIVKKSASSTGISVLDVGERLPFGSSDHASFAAKKVPWVLFHTGIHADLHSPRDDADKIDYGKMEKVSRMAFLAGYAVANLKGNITLKSDK